MSEEQPDAGKVFDAAKAIVETLTGLDRAHQERAIRFASEALGLGFPAHAQGPVVPPSQPAVIAIAPPSSQDTPAHTKDIRHFVTAKAPRSDQQFAAVVAYFNRFEAPESLRKETIGAKDLTDAARLAGRKRPNSPLKTLNNAKASGYFDTTEPGKFRISAVGENLVAMTLPGSEPLRGSNRGKSAKRVPGKARKKTKS